MRKSVSLLGLFGLLAIAPLSISSAHAQAIRTWVSGVGDDANPCSRTAPCKTFAGSISKTAAGGEINCLDSAGFGAVTITKSILIDCGSVFGGITNAGTSGVIINAGSSDKVTLRNIDIHGGGSAVLGLNGIRFLAGGELNVENVTIQVQLAGAPDGVGILVNKTTFGKLTVRNVSFVNLRIGVHMTTTAGNIVASISDSKFNGMTINGVEAGTNVFAGVSNSVFSAIGGTAILAATASSTVYAENNMIQNSNVGISAGVSGARINASGNGLYGNSKAFNVAAGAIFRSASNNKIDQNAGDPSNGALALR